MNSIFSNHYALKVRENKILGPYVDGLSQLVVTSYQVIYLSHGGEVGLNSSFMLNDIVRCPMRSV